MRSVQVKEKPILFSKPMVLALLNTRVGTWPAEPIDASKPWKWQTRRLISKKDQAWWAATSWETDDDGWPMVMDDAGDMVRMPAPYPVGTRLWVKETWCPVDDTRFGGERWVDYRATPKYSDVHPAGWDNAPRDAEALKWKSSMFMPRWASRIELEVMEARFQRLQDITEEDAKGEGATPWPHDPQQRMTSGELGIEQPYRGGFACLWDDINEDRATWLSNPYLWAYSLKRLK